MAATELWPAEHGRSLAALESSRHTPPTIQPLPHFDIRPETPVLKKDFPDHHDADLVLKLYELRRESVMRESRNHINAGFWPVALDEAVAITKSDHPLNAAYRQCSTYWEMTYAMARHGVIHADFMLESTGEGLLLFARIEPWLAEFRAATGNPALFRNAEWVAAETDMGRQIMERFRARVRARQAGK